MRLKCFFNKDGALHDVEPNPETLEGECSILKYSTFISHVEDLHEHVFYLPPPFSTELVSEQLAVLEGDMILPVSETVSHQV